MAYAVRTTLRAEQDLHSIFLYIQADSSPAANKWFNGLVDAIQTLAGCPQLDSEMWAFAPRANRSSKPQCYAT
jgi:plasmid stabilization system protein ParE